MEGQSFGNDFIDRVTEKNVGPPYKVAPRLQFMLRGLFLTFHVYMSIVSINERRISGWMDEYKLLLNMPDLMTAYYIYSYLFAYSISFTISEFLPQISISAPRISAAAHFCILYLQPPNTHHKASLYSILCNNRQWMQHEYLIPSKMNAPIWKRSRNSVLFLVKLTSHSCPRLWF